ncbi:MAG: hypothetical protein M5U26_12345 [Planctomycetota bacterium]|nr:hypothetical protein [Planctomycetota bacterium]
MVFSDGVVNAGQPLAEAAAAWGARGVPLFFVALGEDRPQPPDAALEQPTARPESEAPSGADGAPRAGDPIVVEARAQLLPGSKGLDGPLADTDARLWVLGPLGDPRATAYVEADRLRHRLRASPAWTAIRLRFTPKRAGFYRLRVTLDALPGERRLANNVAYAGVEIDPPRRRVVFAASRLGHDYRALKELFSRWSGPHVEIVADFVRAPTGSETQGWPVEAALRRWLDESVPASARAGTLVWAEPDPAHLPEALQARLRMALQQGELGLVWIVNEPAGALERRLRGSPLADTFLYKGLGAEEAPGTPQAVAGAEAARAHEATAWAYDGTGGEPWTAWGASRAWGGFALPRDGTQVLLHAGATPLLSTGKVGEGRVALLACGESWRWLTPAPQDPLRAQGLERAEAFWRRLADWAAGDPGRLDAPVRLYLARTRWERGETPQARVAVRMPAGLERCRVEAAVARLTGGGAAPVALEWRPLGRLEAAPGEPPGRERVVAGPVGAPLEQAGEYLIAARALRDDAPFGEDRAHLVAEGSPLEDRSVRPDLEGLQAAARAAGGASRVLQPDQEDLLALLDELDMRLLAPETVWREERRPAVPRTAILILLLAALAVDAWLRRG